MGGTITRSLQEEGPRSMQQQSFADWLDRTLTERKISGGEVARSVGKSDGTVSKWRSGKAKPSLASVRKLAAFLDVDPLRLIVTAGLMSSEEAGVDRLPIPRETVRVQRAKEQIMKNPYLSRGDREALLKTLVERYPR